MGLVLDGVVAGREGRALHAPIHAELASGDALTLRGRNGSGKSTLLQCLAGLRPVLEGRIHFGLDLGKERERVRYAPQALPFHPTMTPTQFAAAYHGVRAEHEPDWAHWDLHALRDRPLGRLSGGQQRRAVLATLLAPGAALYLLDEPWTHLDEVAAQQLEVALQARRADSAIVVVADPHARGIGQEVVL